MKTMDLTDEKKGKLLNLENSSYDVLNKMFENEEVDDLCKMSLQVMKEAHKVRQDETHRQLLEWAMVSAVGTPEQKNRFVSRLNLIERKALKAG